MKTYVRTLGPPNVATRPRVDGGLPCLWGSPDVTLYDVIIGKDQMKSVHSMQSGCTNQER
ncbi:hypothetical protein DD238_006365 [Peronospora effusa]|uniref:Uncharacterized protein n=1 Tax=Peronospora effusa TaxID=542832 RepID=A0A3M6VE36_9STRA|nr:hypothetical protein DD238_006365 [Peronospora effusa]RQM09810.1 hypothetical protein DD237_006805 [Peronospora effusa]